MDKNNSNCQKYLQKCISSGRSEPITQFLTVMKEAGDSIPGGQIVISDHPVVPYRDSMGGFEGKKGANPMKTAKTKGTDSSVFPGITLSEARQLSPEQRSILIDKAENALISAPSDQ